MRSRTATGCDMTLRGRRGAQFVMRSVSFCRLVTSRICKSIPRPLLSIDVQPPSLRYSACSAVPAALHLLWKQSPGDLLPNDIHFDPHNHSILTSFYYWSNNVLLASHEPAKCNRASSGMAEIPVAPVYLLFSLVFSGFIGI